MRFSNPNLHNLVFLFLVFLIFFASVSSSISTSFSQRLLCGNASNSSNIHDNLKNVTAGLSAIVHSQNWGIFSITNPPPHVYGLAQCYGHISSEECQDCFNSASEKLQSCLPSESGRLYLDGCFHRYDTREFYYDIFDPNSDNVTCGTPTPALTDPYTVDDFENKLNRAVSNVTDKAVANDGFGTTEVKGGALTVYALAQCWKTIDAEHCKQCLHTASADLTKCVPGAEGRAMFAGCFMRYSTTRFFKQIAEPGNNQKKYNHLAIAAIVISLITFTALAAIGAFIGYKRLSRGKKRLGQIERFPGRTGLNFNYEVLEMATDSFDESRKLGQGGSGSVYKGILPSGKVIAVKRLFFSTRQWADHFFNEVNTISGIQHKNLVSLLGCSIEGPESLLVYEYVQNKSLDQFIFAKNMLDILSWQQRFNIICGTAEGLAYLHGGSGVKIIHRDIKTGNILLDDDLTPKIADFGLVRCVASDRSHVSTAIAGTLGYMAPEYLVRGQLTEKADVYAFGVLILEVATGKKNSVFSQGSSSILYSVWKHYRGNNITEGIDPGLEGRFNEKEASTVLQIGLLCTQASATLRPIMSEVVQMLTEEDCAIPSPRQPPFLNASVISPDDSSVSSLMETLSQEHAPATEANYSSRSVTLTRTLSRERRASLPRTR